jgi:hypothetical protein
MSHPRRVSACGIGSLLRELNPSAQTIVQPSTLSHVESHIWRDLVKQVNENGHLATHMRVDHMDSGDKWKWYENHEWMMNWHLKIHQYPGLWPSFIRILHDHNMDDLLRFMEEGI